jgi:RND family efflux transporter MFP subunit
MKSSLAIILASPALAAGILLTGCHAKKEIPTAAKLPVVQVRTQAVAQKTYLASEDVVGTVRAKTRATIEAKISGRIDSMLVTPGQLVKAGDLMVTLDVREIQAKLDQVKAMRDQAEQDLKRYEVLLQQKAATQQEYDAIQARYRVASGSVTETETLLSYTKILAPFAGVVSRKLADVGDLAVPGKALVDLEDPASLRLEADIPEGLMNQVRLGAKMSARVEPLKQAIEGTVSEIAPIADPNSRTFRIKLDLPPNPNLRPGQFGRVVVPIQEVTSIRIPKAALVVRGQMEIVFVVTQQTAQMRLVKTGKQFDQEIEVVSGLNPDETLVVEGTAQLLDGQSVEAQR